MALYHEGSPASLARADVKALACFHTTAKIEFQSHVMAAGASPAPDFVSNALLQPVPCGRVLVHLEREATIATFRHIIGSASLLSHVRCKNQLGMIAARASHLT
jgi:hypothetical protein